MRGRFARFKEETWSQLDCGRGGHEEFNFPKSGDLEARMCYCQ